MKILDMQNEILRLKKEKDICILAHSYQRREITEIADFVGDSYALAKKAAAVPNKTVIMCGVRFMAETVKILSPEKTVYLANKDAGCPMAEQMDREIIEQLKSMNPGYAVVAYINTTAELKTVCDVCVTSSSAVKIVTSMPEKDILFIPDINLGTYIKNQIPDKKSSWFTAAARPMRKWRSEMWKRPRRLIRTLFSLFIPNVFPRLWLLPIMSAPPAELWNMRKIPTQRNL